MARATSKGAPGSGRLRMNVPTSRHSLTLKPRTLRSSISIRLYDRFPRPLTGSLVTLTAPVMKAPPSPRECVGMGMAARSTSSPVMQSSCQAAPSTRAVATPLAGSRAWPMRSTTSSGSQPRASAAVRRLLTAPEKIGHGESLGASNSAGPASERSSAAATSASSCSRLTGREDAVQHPRGFGDGHVAAQVADCSCGHASHPTPRRTRPLARPLRSDGDRVPDLRLLTPTSSTSGWPPRSFTGAATWRAAPVSWARRCGSPTTTPAGCTR